MAKLTIDELRKAHHYYISEGIDKAAVQSEANRNALDKRSSNDSVIHPHPYEDNNGYLCPTLEDGKHDFYKEEVGLVKNG